MMAVVTPTHAPCDVGGSVVVLSLLQALHDAADAGLADEHVVRPSSA
jgi:hypothetical protein